MTAVMLSSYLPQAIPPFFSFRAPPVSSASTNTPPTPLPPVYTTPMSLLGISLFLPGLTMRGARGDRCVHQPPASVDTDLNLTRSYLASAHLHSTAAIANPSGAMDTKKSASFSPSMSNSDSPAIS
ncbi:hypothetical protein BT96DRAFT_988040 [Gymnopus androsaceus JB14]|uniref:Uncharacterized protein n=1 Tax=Gymnopus androsaceus JB14 TaxID=1447944 RepID=A0A6A4I505_9AGAR|nr:hypothetical protein BT96DRAFT_988040 [Gymnopus androsaceus JB14]